MVDRHRLQWFAAEAPRFVMQLTETLLELQKLESLPQGDGHPVVFLPGFCTGNGATYFMRRVLREHGHHTLGWNHGPNLGIDEKLVETVIDQVNHLAWEHQQKVSLVGQSLGGTVARVVANMIPHEVRSIITLGSPINGLTGVLDHVKTMYDLKTICDRKGDDMWNSYCHMINENPPLPCTSIYSKTDGVVHWGESMVIETDIAENVEVHSSHLSMGFDIYTIKIIADRLSQPEGHWLKYKKETEMVGSFGA